jgi:hypothetical protein
MNFTCTEKPFWHLVSLWNVKQAIDTIPDTYEINEDSESYNFRASTLMRELREQIERYSCNGGVWTQTTDVEGEVNGLYTYDRRVLRPDAEQWKEDIESLYEAARGRAEGQSQELKRRNKVGAEGSHELKRDI